MLRRPSSAAFGGVGESLFDSGIAVFGKDGLPGQVRQCRSSDHRAGPRADIPIALIRVVFARLAE
jgi:hypothetical protein